MSISFFGTAAAMPGPNVIFRAVRGAVQTGFGPIFPYPYDIMGRTLDAGGAVLGNCEVQLFRTEDDSYVSSTTSDVSGNYAIPASNQLTHYLVAYLAGSPDVAGTTVNTLTGT